MVHKLLCAKTVIAILIEEIMTTIYNEIDGIVGRQKLTSSHFTVVPVVLVLCNQLCLMKSKTTDKYTSPENRGAKGATVKLLLLLGPLSLN